MSLRSRTKLFCFIVFVCIVTVLGLMAFTGPKMSLNRIYNFSSMRASFQAPGTHENSTAKNATASLPETVKKATTPMPTKSLFSRIMSCFDWNSYQEAVLSSNLTELDVSLEKLIQLLQYFLILEPKVPVNTTCKPPKLPLPYKLNCSWKGYGNGLSGELNSKSEVPKIGILIQLGFNADVLEIYLNEVYDLVDQFFIIESTEAHYRGIRKALIWEEVKYQERFAKFAPKITHLLIDDSENAINHVVFQSAESMADKSEQVMWAGEKLQERLRWTKFMEWNKARKFFGDDDLLGFGDADEIPARKMIHVLKHCSLREPTVDFGIWFPFGNINKAFRTDYPVRGHPYTLGDPSFWKLKSAMESYESTGISPGRRRGTGNTFLLGGMHMTHYGYLPYQLMNYITCSECGPWMFDVNEVSEAIKADEIRKLEIEHSAVPGVYRSRLVPLESIQKEMSEIAVLPWFYDCQRDRYPAWEGHHDTRLD